MTINGGGTIGLAAIRLSVAVGERHDGTAGTGARIVRSTTISVAIINAVPVVALTVEWLDLNAGGRSVTLNNQGIMLDVTATVDIIRTYQRLLLHGLNNSASADVFAFRNNPTQQGTTNFLNCICYSLVNTSAVAGRDIFGVYATVVRALNVMNVTVHGVTKTGGDGSALGVSMASGGLVACKNIAAMGSGGTTTGTKADFSLGASVVRDHNLSSDTTADGTGSLTSKTDTNQFVSVVGGSEDFHLKFGADAIDTGVDLVTTPTGVNLDIDGYDRDAGGGAWDIGADEFIATGNRRRRLICGAAA